VSDLHAYASDRRQPAEGIVEHARPAWQTRWPPQSHLAPFSWLLTRDVEQGRDELNFSTWDSDDGEADDAADAVAEGSMPPRRYVLVHPDAALGEAERQVLVDALEAMDRSTGRSRPPADDQ